MKRPFSIVLITRDKDSNRELHIKYETETSHPRIEILKFFLKYFFRLKFKA